MKPITIVFDQSTGLTATETPAGSGRYVITSSTVVGSQGPPGPDGAPGAAGPAGPPGPLITVPHTHLYSDVVNPPTIGVGADPLALVGRVNPHQHILSDISDRYRLETGPDTPPRNPSVYDDEFIDTSLASKWTLVTNTVAEIRYATTPSWLQAHFTGDQILTIGESFVPGAGVAFSITAKFSHTGFNAGNFAFAGISAYADANNYLQVAVQWNATTKAIRTNRLLAGVTTNNVQTRNLAASGHDAAYLHFQRNAGTDYRAWCSTDGVGWFPISTTEAASAFAPDITELRLHLNQGGQTAYAWAGWDWVRVNWLTL